MGGGFGAKKNIVFFGGFFLGAPRVFFFGPWKKSAPSGGGAPQAPFAPPLFPPNEKKKIYLGGRDLKLKKMGRFPPKIGKNNAGSLGGFFGGKNPRGPDLNKVWAPKSFGFRLLGFFGPPQKFVF